MKKQLFFAVFTLFTIIAYHSHADVAVTVSSFSFSPSTINIQLGEKITFNISGQHNVNATNVPPGVTTFRSGDPGALTVWEYTPTVTGTYSVQCQLHTSMTATINVSPRGLTTTGTNLTSVCGGNNLQINFNTTGSFEADNNFIAELSDVNGSFSTVTTLLPVNTSTGIITVQIPSTLPSGIIYKVRVASSNPSFKSNSLDQNLVLNYSDPEPSLSLTSNPSGAICPGTILTVTSNVSNNIRPYNLQWFYNGSLTGISQSNYSNTPNNNDLISALVSTTLLGCNAHVFTTSSSINANVSSSILPTVTLNSVTGICNNESITFTGVSNGGGILPAFTLLINGAETTVTNSGLKIINNFTLPGIYNVAVKMVSNLNCVSIATVTSNVLTVTVNSLPQTPDLSITSILGVPLAPPYSLSLNTSISGSFIWFRNDIEIAITTIKGLNVNTDGIYKTAVSQGGCKSFSNLLTIAGGVTSLETNPLIEKITIYPNPVENKLYIATSAGVKKGSLLVEIYDMNGNKQISQYFSENICKGGKGKECTCAGESAIDVSLLQKGFYIVIVKNGAVILKTAKIIKQ